MDREIDKRVAIDVMGLKPINFRISLGEYVAPPYSTNIADAWLVVERMFELGWWHESFRTNEGYFYMFYNGKRNGEHLSDKSAPLAICKAALEAIKGE